MNKQKNPETKPNNLKEMIDYQNDSIVSKTLIKQNGGTVTLFAFTKGQELSEHTAPFDALVYILDGKAEVKISDKINILINGEIIIMPANEPHAIKAPENFKMLLIMIK